MYLVCIICPSPVGIGLTNLLNIGGRRGEVDNAVDPWPPRFQHHQVLSYLLKKIPNSVEEVLSRASGSLSKGRGFESQLQ